MPFQPDELVEREVAIAGLLLRGFTAGQIAVRLRIGKRLVETHIKNMREKLNADNTVVMVTLLKTQPEHQQRTNDQQPES